MRELLFSVGPKDFIIDTFRAGGKGGQHQNKTESGVRIRHPESGACGEARDGRHQHQNKKNAFRRMIATKEFQTWLKLKSSAHLADKKAIERKVEEMMRPENLLIEEV